MNPLHHFIRQRELLRVTGTTDDPILRSFHFTNVERENDRVTRWIATNWRQPNVEDPDLWFAMTVARHINKTETLAVLGYPHQWNSDHFRLTLASAPKPVYGHAYMIKTGRTPGITKADYLAQHVLTPMWNKRYLLRPRKYATLAQQHALFTQCFSIGPFMAQQIIADLMYVEPLKSASDWHTWCAPGPGSQRGLNLLLNLPLNKQWASDEFQSEVNQLQDEINDWWPSEFNLPPLHAQNVTNSLCEFSKYTLAQLGIRNPKRKYRPHALVS